MMTLLTLLLGLVLAAMVILLARELHRTEELVRRLEQHAAHERRPRHGRSIHTNVEEEPLQPVFHSVPQRIIERLWGKR